MVLCELVSIHLYAGYYWTFGNSSIKNINLISTSSMDYTSDKTVHYNCDNMISLMALNIFVIITNIFSFGLCIFKKVTIN